MSYVCPRCGARSEHPIDEAEGYCGRCRDWTGGERTSPFIARVANEAVRRHERRYHPADPPSPIPRYLAPIEAPLGPGDLVFVATRAELAAITAALSDLDLDPSLLRIVHRDGSPWIEFSSVRLDREARAWADRLGAVAIGDPQRFALWRYTLAVYRIGDEGAVEDDPVWRPEVSE